VEDDGETRECEATSGVWDRRRGGSPGPTGPRSASSSAMTMGPTGDGGAISFRLAAWPALSLADPRELESGGASAVGTLPGHVDYDEVAPGYDARYRQGSLPSVLQGLQALVRDTHASRILEAGCGTGHWLQALRPLAQPCGLDLSAGMLRQARRKDPQGPLVRGTASRLPFCDDEFDLVYCVSALHHFHSPRRFLREARRVLRLGGAFCNVGMDPKSNSDRWYIYDYFPGTRETDRLRYPSAREISHWLLTSGFIHVTCGIAGRIRRHAVGAEVLADPILHKAGTSQLTLLSDRAFTQGMEHMRQAIKDAAERGEEIMFWTDIVLHMVTGWLPSEAHRATADPVHVL
jgi:ubiquinone/menaquinone biosynthesis C-methylase UbiE